MVLAISLNKKRSLKQFDNEKKKKKKHNMNSFREIYSPALTTERFSVLGVIYWERDRRYLTFIFAENKCAALL